MRLSGNVQLVSGGRATIPWVMQFLSDAGIDVHANSDLYVRTYDVLGVDEVRDIAARSVLGAWDAGRRVFVLAADAITAEAQNALLKTLEEPGADSLFVIITPSPAQLIATLRSRAQMLALPEIEHGSSDALAFIQSPPSKRLDMLKPLLEKGESDRRELGSILSFLSELEAALANMLPRQGARQGLRALQLARRYLGDRGALAKPLLEQVALLVEKM